MLCSVPGANPIKIITPTPKFWRNYEKTFFNPIKQLLQLKIRQKDIFWRKFWRKFQRSNLCVESWRSLHQKNDFIMPK
jgi:hypothetical protein